MTRVGIAADHGGFPYRRHIAKVKALENPVLV